MTSNAQVLTWAAECEDVYRLDLPAINGGNIAEVPDIRQVCFGNGDGVRLDFACPYRGRAAHNGGKGHCAAAVEQAAQFYGISGSVFVCADLGNGAADKKQGVG